MLESNRALKAFLYYKEEDLSIAQALYERLDLDGVDVIMPEAGILEIDTDEAEENPRLRQRRDTLQRAIEEADLVLFCLSKEFNRLSSVNSERQLVLGTALKKQNGNISVLSVRLEECEVPQSMKRWLTVDLHTPDGYEKLMLAMKLRADKVRAELIPDEGWKESFYMTAPANENAGPGYRLPMPVIVTLLVAAGVAAILFFREAVTGPANAAEWVSSLYLPYPYDPFDDRDNPELDGPRVVRGGSWASPLEEIYTYHRLSLDPESDSVHGNDLRFRCAHDANL